MRQLLHLLIVDPERLTALASWHGARWVLPVVPCSERARAGPLAVRRAVELGVPADAIGQWLGRVMPDGAAIDWLMVLNRAADSRTASAQSWTPIESLISSPSLLDYEQWAVAQALTGAALPTVPGPFGDVTWLDAVKIWIGKATGDPCVGPVISYRTSAYEVVLGVPTRRGCTFFKGLSSARSSEASITSALSHLMPHAFARTIALSERPDGSFWWLAEACAGRSLAEIMTVERGRRVAAAFAKAQQHVVTSADDFRNRLPEVPLSTAAAWSIGLLGRGGPAESFDRCAAAIERACVETIGWNLPQTWIPLDLDPENVLLDDEAVRFIDLDDSYAGPAQLAMATFARRTGRFRVGGREGEAVAALYRAYERGWLPRLTGCQWWAFEIVSEVLDAYLGWRRVVTHTAQGELYDALEVAAARIAKRLARSVSSVVR